MSTYAVYGACSTGDYFLGSRDRENEANKLALSVAPLVALNGGDTYVAEVGRAPRDTELMQMMLAETERKSEALTLAIRAKG